MRRDIDDVAGVYFVLSDRFRIDELLSRVSALPREDRWQSLARMALRYDLYAALAALTGNVLASSAERPGAAAAEAPLPQPEPSQAPNPPSIAPPPNPLLT